MNFDGRLLEFEMLLGRTGTVSVTLKLSGGISEDEAIELREAFRSREPLRVETQTYVTDGSVKLVMKSGDR